MKIRRAPRDCKAEFFVARVTVAESSGFATKRRWGRPRRIAYRQARRPAESQSGSANSHPDYGAMRFADAGNLLLPREREKGKP